jgi:hypothetical protein
VHSLDQDIAEVVEAVPKESILVVEDTAAGRWVADNTEERSSYWVQAAEDSRSVPIAEDTASLGVEDPCSVESDTRSKGFVEGTHTGAPHCPW